MTKLKKLRGYIIWKVPAMMSGADQVLRGPIVKTGVLKGWKWAISRRSDPHPGGLPTKIEEIYTYGKLPAWAKKLVNEDRR